MSSITISRQHTLIEERNGTLVKAWTLDDLGPDFYQWEAFLPLARRLRRAGADVRVQALVRREGESVDRWEVLWAGSGVAA